MSSQEEEAEEARALVPASSCAADAGGGGDETDPDMPDLVDQDGGGMPNFSELLGPDCVIKRVDKDKKVIGGANAADMQHELMTRASAQKRLGACAEHVKDMSWQRKLGWALDLKDRANEFYTASSFEEAARLYNDCLVALDLEGTEEQVEEVKTKLQLPVCTNLGACMLEMGQNARCVEICDIAISVDPGCPKALYRRGLAQYRLGNHVAARPDFEAALTFIQAGRKDSGKHTQERKDLDNLEKRVLVYLHHIRSFSQQERSSCKRMFEEQKEKSLYEDRPGAKAAQDDEPIDDSDEALDAAIARVKGGWCCSPCRRGAREKTS